MLNSPLFLLGFLSIFHIIGGIALGNALNNLWLKLRGQRASMGNGCFFLLWGGGFAFMPLAFGSGEEIPAWFLPMQLLIIVTAMLVGALWQSTLQEWAAPLFNLNVGLMLFGSVFMGFGMLFGFLFTQDAEDALLGWLFIGIFGLVGLGIFLFGLFGILKSFRS
jgi:hypothetical protein